MDDLDAWRLLLADATASADRPRRICVLCVDHLGVSGAGISMVTAEGNRGVVCATDPTAAAIEELQLTVGEGPCVDAVAAGGPVLVDDLQLTGDLVEQRWPAFLQQTQTAGVRAVFAFPLRIGVINVGALDLSRDQPGALAPLELAGALLAADAAALALLDLDDHGGVVPASVLDAGLPLQIQIHQATGLVQAELGVTTEAAFLVLRARAFADGVRLVDLAAAVVARRVIFSGDDR